MAREAAAPVQANVDKVVKLRGEGLKWGEIAESFSTTEGKVQFWYMWGTEPRMKPTPENIVKARNEKNMSWGRMAARCQMSEAAVKAIYEGNTTEKQRVARIGKGGAYKKNDDGTEAKPVKKAVAKKAAEPVKKAAKKMAEASPTGAKTHATDAKVSGLGALSLVDLKNKLDGRSIKVGRTDGTKSEIIAVKSVISSEKGVITLVNAKNNGNRTVKADAIIAVSTKKEEPRPAKKAVAKKAAATAAA